MRLLSDPKIVWAVGLALGVAALAASSLIPEGWAQPASAIATAVVFAAVAALAAALLNRGPAAIALLIAAPITVLLLVSVLFGGNVGAFARHDAVALAAAIAGAFAGAYLGTRLFREAPSIGRA